MEQPNVRSVLGAEEAEPRRMETHAVLPASRARLRRVRAAVDGIAEHLREHLRRP